MTQSQVYHVKAASWILFILTFLIVIFSGIGILLAFLPKGKNESIILIAGFAIVGLAWLSTRWTSVAKTEWVLSDAGIELSWKTQFLLHRRQDRFIPWRELDRYKFQPDRNFDLLKLTTKLGDVIRIWHKSDTIKDDFNLLVSAIRERVAQQNAVTTEAPIIESKNIYQKKSGIAVAVVAAIFLIVLPLLLWKRPASKPVNWPAMTAICAGALFYIVQVWEHRKKRKS